MPPFRSVRQPVPSSCKGATLLEVLITVVVLSVGLLGLAALQATSLSRGVSADMRSQAINAASEMIDLMRANRYEAFRYTGGFGGPCGDIQPPPFNVGGGSVASDERLAWISRLQCTLPGVNGNITLAAREARITIAWADARWEDAPADSTTVVLTSLL